MKKADTVDIPTVTNSYKLQKELEENQIKIAEKVIDLLEYAGVKHTPSDIETIVRVYRASRLLGGSIDIINIIIAVLSKDQTSEEVLRKRLLIAKRVQGKRAVKGKGNIMQRRLVTRFGQERIIMRKQKLFSTQVSAKKLSREEREIINNLRRYLETFNPGYLDLIEEQLKSTIKRNAGASGGKKGMRSRVTKYERRLKTLMEKPNDPFSLTGLAWLGGGLLVPLVILYELNRDNNRSAVKRIHVMIRNKHTRLLYNRYSVRKLRRDTLLRSKNVNLRKTLYNFARMRLGNVVYREKRGHSTILFIIDHSDSMKKYVLDLIRILIGFSDVAGKVILFSEIPKLVKTKHVLTSPRIMRSLLQEGFGGFTDIISALKMSRRHAAGKTVVLISDLEQTVRSGGDLFSEILKIANRSRHLFVFTTSNGARVLTELMLKHDPSLTRRITILEELGQYRRW